MWQIFVQTLIKIILNKKISGEQLSAEENQIARKHYTEEEIQCMRPPQFDHSGCFSKRKLVRRPAEELIGFNPKI